MTGEHIDDLLRQEAIDAYRLDRFDYDAGVRGGDLLAETAVPADAIDPAETYDSADAAADAIIDRLQSERPTPQ